MKIHYMNRYMAIVICSGYIFCADAVIAASFIAHRGASNDAPENTIAAINMAWQQGADGIEVDFHLTQDGEIVCIHDDNTKRVAVYDIRVAEATLAELRQLDIECWKGNQWNDTFVYVYNDQAKKGCWKGNNWKDNRIPTIDEVLATVHGKGKIFIEIKCGTEILPALNKALAKSKLQSGQTVIISFDMKVLTEIKQQIPQLKTLWLTAFKADKNTGVVSPTAREILATLEQIGADGVDCNAHTIVDQQFVQTIRTSNKEVHVWTVDDVSVAKRFLQLNVDSITSNRAGWLKQQLRRETEKKAESDKEQKKTSNNVEQKKR